MKTLEPQEKRNSHHVNANWLKNKKKKKKHTFTISSDVKTIVLAILCTAKCRSYMKKKRLANWEIPTMRCPMNLTFTVWYLCACVNWSKWIIHKNSVAISTWNHNQVKYKEKTYSNRLNGSTTNEASDDRVSDDALGNIRWNGMFSFQIYYA